MLDKGIDCAGEFSNVGETTRSNGLVSNDAKAALQVLSGLVVARQHREPMGPLGSKEGHHLGVQCGGSPSL